MRGDELKQAALRVRILVCLGLASFSACSQAPNRTYLADVDLSILLVTMDNMPPGWSTIGPATPGIESYRGKDSTGIVFTRYGDEGEIGFAQWIYRFPSERRAQVDYSGAVETYVLRGYMPSATVQEESYGDESKFACYQYPNLPYPVCAWVVRYGQVVTDVHIDLVPGVMDLAELERLMQQIDRRMNGPTSL